MGADTDGLIAFGESHGLAPAVCGSLGDPIALPELLSNTNLLQIAKAHGRTPEEVTPLIMIRDPTHPQPNTKRLSLTLILTRKRRTRASLRSV